MKKTLKFITIFVLTLLARLVLRRYRPRVVMVSGSVGKTATKDAVAAALETKFYIRKSEKSFNSEFGVPFTILGVENPLGVYHWTNPIAWLLVAKSALALLLLPNHYPSMLVLEVGADRPGDLARILRFVTPDAVVITRLPNIPVHVEAYASPEDVREEEFSPAYALAPGAPLIVSSDDSWAAASARRVPARIFHYGTKETGVHISNTTFRLAGGKVIGMQAEIKIGDERGVCVVKGSVGATQLLPLAAALAVAKAFEIQISDALTAFKEYEAPPGRGRIFDGKNGSIIIDDSYNASPAAVEEALSTLKSFPNAKRRIAVLGDMLELGRYSVVEHERIAALAGESADVIVAVGIRARAFARAPKNAEVILFDDARSAATALAGFVQAGDVVLVKGSQSIRTERIVEALLADSSDAAKLVRQEKKWKEKV